MTDIYKARGVAKISGVGGPISNRDLSCIVSTNVEKSLFLHRVDNVEHNIKQSVYTGMEVIFLISP